MGDEVNSRIGWKEFFSLPIKNPTEKMKLLFVVALVVMIGGISGGVIPGLDQELEKLRKFIGKVIAFDSPGGISGRSLEVETVNEKRNWCDALECKILDAVVDGLHKIKTGKRMEERAWCDAIECQIFDVIVAALKPILAKFKDIILNSKKTLEEKVQEVWEHAKDALTPIISLVGNVEKTKEILRQFIAKVIAFDAPWGIAGRSLELEVVNEKRAWCDAFECQIFDIVVDGLKNLKKFKDQVMENVNKKKVYCDALECEIMDIVVEVLKPILAKFKDIIMDSGKSLAEKVNEIWESAKKPLMPVISLVGSEEKTKEILTKVVAKAIENGS